MLLAGRGIVLTSETPIASPPPPAPHIAPRRAGRITPNKTMIPARARCSPTDIARGRPRLPCSRKMSVSAAILVERLGHDAHVGNASALDCVHDGGEGAERDLLIGANEDRLVLGIPYSLAQAGFDVVDVDGIVAEKHALLLVDADHQTLFGDFLHGARFGDIDFDPRLQHGSSHHEDDEKY